MARPKKTENIIKKIHEHLQEINLQLDKLEERRKRNGT